MIIVLRLTESAMKSGKLSDFIAAHEPHIEFGLSVSCSKSCDENIVIPAVIIAGDPRLVQPIKERLK